MHDGPQETSSKWWLKLIVPASPYAWYPFPWNILDKHWLFREKSCTQYLSWAPHTDRCYTMHDGPQETSSEWWFKLIVPASPYAWYPFLWNILDKSWLFSEKSCTRYLSWAPHTDRCYTMDDGPQETSSEWWLKLIVPASPYAWYPFSWNILENIDFLATNCAHNVIVEHFKLIEIKDCILNYTPHAQIDDKSW